jgi:hypothetical protein
MEEVTPRRYECWINIPLDDEDFISGALRKAFPALKWEAGDSSWDKIKVWGESSQFWVSVYRYEEPGPFRLRIQLKTPDAASDQEDFRAIRETVLAALRATAR